MFARVGCSIQICDEIRQRWEKNLEKTSGLSMDHVRNKRCAIDVFNCLDGLAPMALENHM